LGLAIHHHTQRHTVDTGTDAPARQACPRVDRNHMGLARIPDLVRVVPLEHMLEHDTLIELRAADPEIVDRPLAALVLAPCLAQPLAVRLKATRGQDTGACLDAFTVGVGGNEASITDIKGINRRVVAYLYTQRLGASVIR